VYFNSVLLALMWNTNLNLEYHLYLMCRMELQRRNFNLEVIGIIIFF